MAAYDTIILAESGLVSYWPLSEASGTMATDLKSAFNGTYTAGFTLGGAGPSAQFGGSTAFNGTTGYVTVPDTANLRLNGSAMSVEAWVKFVALSTGSTNFPAFIAKSATTVNGWAWALHSNDGGAYSNKPFMPLFNASTEKDSSTTGTASGTGVWEHLVCTYDNVDVIKWYRNGILINTTTGIGASGVGSSAGALLIANWAVTGTGFLNGSEAGAAVYNSVLTQAQVGYHYASGLRAQASPIDGVTQGAYATVTAGDLYLTTSGSNRIIIVAVMNSSGTTDRTVTSVAGGGLTWARRYSHVGAGGHGNIEVWWALAASPLSGAVITITLSGTGDFTAVAFGLSGFSTTSPFDPNVAVPAFQATSSTSPAVTISTTNPTGILLAFFGDVEIAAGGTEYLNIPSGYTAIAGTAGGGGSYPSMMACYKSVSAVQSSVTVTWGAVSGTPYPVLVVDALTTGSPSNSAPFLLAHL